MLKAEEPVETDLHYWLMHALHWQAFLVVVTTGLYVGYVFAPSKVGAAADPFAGLPGHTSTASAPATSLVASGTNALPSAISVAAFTKDLKVGSQDHQVTLLQQFLNTHGYVIAKTGPGSPGNETDLFGGGTRTALTAWQAKNGLSSEKGVIGAKTRAVLNRLVTVAPVAAAPKNVLTTSVVAVFTKDLKTGSKDNQVLLLQQFLNTHGFVIVKSGPGSPGNETNLFGAGTRTALAAWQAKNGLSSEKGVVGAKTRAVLNRLVSPPTKPPSASAPSFSVTPLFPPFPSGAVSNTAEVPGPQPWDLGTVSLSGPAKVKVGTSFSVTAVLSNATNVDTFRLNGNFDPTLLKLTKVSPLIFELESPANAINNASGTFSYGRFSVIKRVNGLVKMATFTFTPLKNGTSTIELSSTSHALVDGQEDGGSFHGLALTISGGKK